MASAGKKGKKSKVKSIPLQKFLASEGDGIQEGYTVVTTKRVIDWASEVEKEEDDNVDPVYSSRDKYILPSAPMGPNVDISKVPNSPPFTAFLGNLPYEIEKEDISAFFKDLKIASVRLPRAGGDTGRPRGFGYVEFEDRQSLIEALAMSDTHLRNGRVKIDVAENQGDDPNRRRDNRGERSDRADRPERTAALSADWRSSPREEPTQPESRERSGFRDGGGGGESRERYNDRYSSDRDKDRYANRPFDRSSFGTDRERDFGSDRERSGGFGGNRGFSDREPRERQYDRGYNQDNRDSYNGYDRGSYDRGGRTNRREFGTGYRGDDKNNDYARGSYDRSSGGGAGGSYDRSSGAGGTYERGSGGSYDRSGGYNDSNEVEERDPQEKELPRERPKLVLQKRTIPIQEAGQPVAPAAIFGGAKPVDTAAREREIELRFEKEAAAKLAAEATEKDREIHRDDYRSSDAPEKSRRPSTGTQGRSPRSSTSIPPSSDDGSHHSEGDDSGNRPPSTRKASSSSETVWTRRSSSNAQPLPPSSGGPRQRNSEVGDSYGKRNSNYGNADHGGNDRSYYRSYQSENVRDDRGMSRGRGGSRGGSMRGSSYMGVGGERRDDREGGGSGGYDDPPRERSRDRERLPKEMPKFEGPKAPVYTSVNKFSGLPVSDDED